MTERILPALAIAVPGHRVADDPARPDAAATRRPRAAAQRKEVLLTMPARAGILIGTSAAVYAATLAGIAVVQSSSDAAVAARRQPFLDAVAETRAMNNALEATLRAADEEARSLAARYEAVGAHVAAYQAQLDNLAALVAEVEGSAAALPSRITLPVVSMRGAIPSARVGSTSGAPATTTTSGASGG